jgi:hypothetical protein
VNRSCRSLLRAAFAALSVAPLAAVAATHVACVGSAVEFTAALASLNTSTANVDADEIRIRTGHYLAPEGGWVGAVTTRHDLSILGGWTDATCTQRTPDPTQTILDGHQLVGVLTINTPLIPDSDVVVSGLTFQNGKGGNAFESNAGGLKIGDPNPISGGRILVERNIFRNNTAVGNGFSGAIGGLLAATDGESLVVRNNLFLDNTSPNSSAAYLYSNNRIDVVNNTFVGNDSVDVAQATRVALGYFTLTGLALGNNVFWNNAGGPGAFDVDAGGAQFSVGAALANNDLQSIKGEPVAEAGTLHVDPLFSGPLFSLQPTSPLIDRGFSGAAGGIGDLDLVGAARVQGNNVDIGAYEVAASSTGAPIGGGMSGNWFDPSPNQGGHGFQIEVLPDNGMLAIWFVFNPAGTAQGWIFAQGVYTPGSATTTLPAFIEQGGAFPPNFDSRHVDAKAWGTLKFEFDDCDHGSATWTANADSAAAGYHDVTFPIQRLTRIVGTACP